MGENISDRRLGKDEGFQCRVLLKHKNQACLCVASGALDWGGGGGGEGPHVFVAYYFPCLLLYLRNGNVPCHYII